MKFLKCPNCGFIFRSATDVDEDVFCPRDGCGKMREITLDQYNEQYNLNEKPKK